MEASIISAQDLHVKIAVKVPPENIDKEYNRIISETSKKVRLNGFRPGKVPKNIIEKRYGQELINDTMEEVIPKLIKEACDQHSLRTATRPTLGEWKWEPGTPLNFEFEFEKYPNAEMEDFSFLKLDVVKPKDVSQEDVDLEKNRILKDFGNYEIQEKAAAEGDKITLKINKIGDKIMEGEDVKSEDIYLEEGVLQEIKDSFIGKKAGDSFSLNIPKKPDQGVHNDLNLEGLIDAISEKVPATEDEAFYEKVNTDFRVSDELKVKDRESLDAFIRHTLEGENKRKFEADSISEIRTQLMEKLEFLIPNQVLEQRKQQIYHQLKHHPEHKDGEEHDREEEHHDHSVSQFDENNPKDKELMEEATQTANREIRLMYFIDSYLDKNKISVDHRKVSEYVAMHCYQMGIRDVRSFVNSEEGQYWREYYLNMERESAALKEVLNKVLPDAA